MFGKILDKFHKSKNQKGKLLKFKEFCELDKPIKKLYIRGLFHKRQAGARQISQEIRQKQTIDTIYATESSSSTIYSEANPAYSTKLTQPTQEPFSASNDRIVYEDKTKLREIINSTFNTLQFKSRKPEKSFELLRFRKFVHDPIKGTCYYINIYPTTNSTTTKKKAAELVAPIPPPPPSQPTPPITEFMKDAAGSAPPHPPQPFMKKFVSDALMRDKSDTNIRHRFMASSNKYLLSHLDRCCDEIEIMMEHNSEKPSAIAIVPDSLVRVKSDSEIQNLVKYSWEEDLLAHPERCWDELDLMLEILQGEDHLSNKVNMKHPPDDFSGRCLESSDRICQIEELMYGPITPLNIPSRNKL